MRHFTLSGRIAVWLGVAAVVILGMAAFTMDHMVDAEMERRMDESLLAQAKALASLVDVHDEQLSVGRVEPPRRHLLSGQATAFWAVRCTDGSRMDSQEQASVYPMHWADSARAQPVFADISAGTENLYRATWFRFAVDPVGNVQTGTGKPASCAVLFMRSRQELDDILTTIDAVLLMTPLLALLAVWLVSPMLVRRGLKPLRSLGEAMRSIGPQNPGKRLDMQEVRELEPLVSRFNEVLARMDEGIAHERQFAGALAHETRTHLAELRALVEVEQRYPSGRSLADLLADIGGIAEELQATVSGLLLLTRLEAGIEGQHPLRLSLHDVLRKLLAASSASLQLRQLEVALPEQAEDVVLVVDRALLEIVMGNLLGNAIAYAPEGSTIDVQWQPQGLRVSNEAAQLQADEVAFFGQRFWSKHHGSDGHVGLGLALAGAAATAMHMQLDFELDDQQCLHATLRWPSDLEASGRTDSMAT